MQSTEQIPEMPLPLVGIDERVMAQPHAVESKRFLDGLILASKEANHIQGGQPAVLIQTEKPIHRVICYMALAGSTNQEIAQETGFTPQTVRNILLQPRAKAFIAEQARLVAGESIERFFAAEAHLTASKMIELRDDEKTPPAVVAAICRDILDRHLGKPTQYVKSEQVKTIDDAAKEASEIEKELAALRALAYGRNTPASTN
jgi:hypothetical protein